MIGGNDMSWWSILKNTKLSGKAKGEGTSFDASQIKINIDKDDCCDKFWIKIQQYLNDNIIVISSLRKLRDKDDYDFKGIGHRLYESQTKVFPSPSEFPCSDSAAVYLQITKYAEEIRSIPDTGNFSDKILPFKLKHYKHTKDIRKDVREWHQLKDSFYHEWHSLRIAIKKCPDLAAAIKEKEWMNS